MQYEVFTQRNEGCSTKWSNVSLLGLRGIEPVRQCDHVDNMSSWTMLCSYLPAHTAGGVEQSSLCALGFVSLHSLPWGESLVEGSQGIIRKVQLLYRPQLSSVVQLDGLMQYNQEQSYWARSHSGLQVFRWKVTHNHGVSHFKYQSAYSYIPDRISIQKGDTYCPVTHTCNWGSNDRERREDTWRA